MNEDREKKKTRQRGKKWTRRDLNPRPTASTRCLCKADVVTTPPRAPKSASFGNLSVYERISVRTEVHFIRIIRRFLRAFCFSLLVEIIVIAIIVGCGHNTAECVCICKQHCFPIRRACDVGRRKVLIRYSHGFATLSMITHVHGPANNRRLSCHQRETGEMAKAPHDGCDRRRQNNDRDSAYMCIDTTLFNTHELVQENNRGRVLISKR